MCGCEDVPMCRCADVPMCRCADVGDTLIRKWLHRRAFSFNEAIYYTELNFIRISAHPHIRTFIPRGLKIEGNSAKKT
jgi:hypothetical protein